MDVGIRLAAAVVLIFTSAASFMGILPPERATFGMIFLALAALTLDSAINFLGGE